MIKTITLEINSWAGISIGAIHYYGKLLWHADNEYQQFEIRRVLDKEAAYKLTKQKNYNRNPDYWTEWVKGDDTECFDSKGDIKEIALAIWKEHFPEAELLICGRYDIGDPQEVMAADDPKLMKKINNLCDIAEEIGYYEGNYRGMTAISNAYCELVD